MNLEEHFLSGLQQWEQENRRNFLVLPLFRIVCLFVVSFFLIQEQFSRAYVLLLDHTTLIKLCV